MKTEHKFVLDKKQKFWFLDNGVMHTFENYSTKPKKLKVIVEINNHLFTEKKNQQKSASAEVLSSPISSADTLILQS